MIVDDTNVVAYLVIDGDHTQHAEAVRSRDSDWRVPALFVHEWLNVVAVYLRRGIFERDEAVRVYRRGLAFVNIEPLASDAVTVFNLVEQSKCSSYDCQFVALAQTRNAKLITTDQQVLQAFPAMTEDLVLST